MDLVAVLSTDAGLTVASAFALAVTGVAILIDARSQKATLTRKPVRRRRSL